MTDNERLFGILGLCRRANKISHGHDASVASIIKREAALCLVSSDASERLYNDIVFACEKANNKTIVSKLQFTMDEIGMCLGAKKAAVITINDQGFAKKINELIGRETDI